MRQSHIALIVAPKDTGIVAVPWLTVPQKPTHSGFTQEEEKIMARYYDKWQEYNDMVQIAIPCNLATGLAILEKQHPNREVLEHIKGHYNVTDVTLSELLGKPKRIPKKGELLTCVYNAILPGNEIGPKLVLQEKYKLQGIARDKKGNMHFSVGLQSQYNYIRSYETGKELPNGKKIHWCHPLRFIW